MGICARGDGCSLLEPLGSFGGRGQALHSRSKSEDLGGARAGTADSADIFFSAFRRRSCP